MTEQEVLEAIEELKQQGFTEDEFLLVFYTIFQNDDINLEQLAYLVDLFGYELTEEFLAMSPEDQKTKGYEDAD